MIINNVAFGIDSEAIKLLAMVSEFYCHLENCEIDIKNIELKFLKNFPHLFNFKTVGLTPASKLLYLWSALTAA